MGQNASNTNSIFIDYHTLEVVDEFTYLGFIFASNLSLDVELNKLIAKAATAIAR